MRITNVKAPCPNCGSEIDTQPTGVDAQGVGRVTCPACGHAAETKMIESDDIRLDVADPETGPIARRIARLSDLADKAPPDLRKRAMSFKLPIKGAPETGFVIEDTIGIEQHLAEYEPLLDYAPGETDPWARVVHGLHIAQERAAAGATWEHLKLWASDITDMLSEGHRIADAKGRELADMCEAAGFKSVAASLREFVTDYAPGETDPKARALAGLRAVVSDRTARGTSTHLLRLRDDMDAFVAAARRHEYSLADINEVMAALEESTEGLDREKAVLAETAQRMSRGGGPSHLIALEKKFLATRTIQPMLREGRLKTYGGDAVGLAAGGTGARLCGALKSATPYCWSPECVEAVASAGQKLPGSARPTPTALGPLAGPGSAGWWWFERPIPVAASDDSPGVSALLWRRGEHEGQVMTEFAIFAERPMTLNGRTQLVPVPEVSWIWRDATDLDALAAAGDSVEAAYADRGERFRVPMQFYARLWLAAGLWLQQRVLTKQRTWVPRQPGRALQREHKLETFPTVEIVYLRRPAPRGSPEGEHHAVDWSCRWVVGGTEGFWRDQWHPSTQEHVPTWIAPYIKGPADKPLKTATRIYAVNR